MQNQPDLQNKNSMTIWLVILVIVIIAVLGIIGYYLYKIGTQENSGEAQSSAIDTSGLDSLNIKTKTTAPPTTPSPTTTNSASEGQTYPNSRFGFSVKEPTGFSRFESQNGDGASFSKDSPPVSIGVYGSNNIENLTATQYLDKEFSTLNMQTPDAKELSWSTVDMDGCSGEKRVWQYTPTTGSGQSNEAMAICTKGAIVYGLYMTLSTNDYDQYSSVFDQMLTSFKFAD